MEEGRPAEAARHRLAVEFEAGRRASGYYANVKIYSPRVALAMAASSLVTGAVTVGACYRANPEATKAAVRSVFRDFAEVLGIKESSISVELYFHTSRSLLLFMTALEAKIIKQRLQRELSKIGFKDELEVTIVNCKEIYDTLIREEMEKRSSDLEVASDSSGVETMESEDELSQPPSPGEPLTPPLSDLEELREGSKSADPKLREEMEKRSSDFEADSDSSGVETMESEEELSQPPSPGEPLTLSFGDLEGEELAEEVTPASDKPRREMMKAAAASPLVKAGIPPNCELEYLAFDMAIGWKELGRRLRFREPVLEEIDRGNEEPSEKIYNMLILWKQKNGRDATYKALYDALQHGLVKRRDLAEKFCCKGL